MIMLNVFQHLMATEKKYWSKREQTEYVRGVLMGLKIAQDQVAIKSQTFADIVKVPSYKGNILYNGIKSALAHLKRADRQKAINTLEKTIESFGGSNEKA